MNQTRIVRLFQGERKACGGFGGEEIKDQEANNMAQSIAHTKVTQ